jgi:hypothetical protein
MKKTFTLFILLLSLLNLKAQIKKSNNLKFNCAPIDYNPKILSSPIPNSIHPEWKESEVGSSWSFISSKKIENKDGIFLFGNLISPKGGVLCNACYIIYSEWECTH